MKKNKKNLLYLIIILALLFLGLIFSSFFFKQGKYSINRFHFFGFVPKIFKDFLTKNKIINIGSGNLPVYNLILSKKDTTHYNNLFSEIKNKGELEADPIVRKKNKARKVVLEHNNKKVKAQIKIHGGYSHWKFNKKSYNLEALDDELIDKIEKIQFIVPEDRSFLTPIIFKHIAQSLNLPYPENGFAEVSINGSPQGLYYYEEDIDEKKTFFEKNKLPNDFSLRPVEGLIWDWDLRSWQTAGTRKTDNIYHQEVLQRLKRFLQAVESEDQAELEELVDFPKVAAFEALRTLKGSWGTHDFQLGNLRVAYSIDSGKFYFIPRVEARISDIPIERPRTIQTFEHSITYYYPPTPLHFFHALLRNKKFRHLRNQYFRELLSDDWIIRKYLELKNEYMGYFLKDIYSNISRWNIRNYIEKDLTNLENNIELIRDNLSISKCFVTLTQKNNKITIDLVPDSMAALEIKTFKIFLKNKSSFLIKPSFEHSNEDIRLYNRSEIELAPFYKDQILFASLNEELFAQRATFSLEIEGFNNNPLEIEDVQIEIENTFTGTLLDEEQILAEILNADFDYKTDSYLSLGLFLQKYGELSWNVKGRQLTLIPAKYSIKRNIIIPRNLEIVFPAGVILEIAPRQSILSYSPIAVQGTKGLPVQVRAENFQEPFGVFAILGNKGDSCEVKIDYLDLSRGSETFLNGVFYNGALSIHYCDVVVKNSIFRSNNGDDGINIKHGNGVIKNSLFENNKFDSIDFDFNKGEISNNTVLNSGNDGIDLGSADPLVFANKIKNSQDKGISIGELSKPEIKGNMIENNNIGIAVKDSSQPRIYENEFSDNRIGLASYQKKPFFPRKEFEFFDNYFENNEIKYSTALDEIQWE